MTKAIKIIKTKKANISFGDRASEIRTPATYQVIADGDAVATITCDTDGGYMSSRTWELRSVNFPSRVWYRKTLKEAKEKAVSIFSAS